MKKVQIFSFGMMSHGYEQCGTVKKSGGTSAKTKNRRLPSIFLTISRGMSHFRIIHIFWFIGGITI